MYLTHQETIQLFPFTLAWINNREKFEHHNNDLLKTYAMLLIRFDDMASSGKENKKLVIVGDPLYRKLLYNH